MKSCPDCRKQPASNRTEAGHLALDPKSGATILTPHKPKETRRV